LHDYFDKPDYYQTKAGVVDRKKLGNRQLTEGGQCKVCLEEKIGNEFYALGCGHSYCRDCWQYVEKGEERMEGKRGNNNRK
jgi:hypothetical protein